MRFAAICLTLLAGTSASFADTAGERVPTCLACHGAKGTSETEGVPSLGGQPSDYLLVQLLSFRDKQRIAEPMNAMTEGLSDADLRMLADRMARLPPPEASGTAAADVLDRGRDLAVKYRCGSCHNPDFSGHDRIPRLAGQAADYLLKALVAYKSKARAGHEPAMSEVQDADMPILAQYFAGFR